MKHAQESPSCVLRHANTHTSRYFTKTPVIQNTQIGWQAATCVSQVLTDSKTMSCQTEMSYVFVSSQQASRQVSQGRKSRAVGRQRYGASKSKEGKGRKANLSTLQTTSSAAQINTFTYRHSLGRHIYRQLSVTSVTSLYLSFFPPICKAGKTERISQGGRKEVKEESDSATTMSFAEAEQIDGAESFASDISWTYSLDLVDSLKPPHSFPL